MRRRRPVFIRGCSALLAYVRRPGPWKAVPREQVQQARHPQSSLLEGVACGLWFVEESICSTVPRLATAVRACHRGSTLAAAGLALARCGCGVRKLRIPSIYGQVNMRCTLIYCYKVYENHK